MVMVGMIHSIDGTRLPVACNWVYTVTSDFSLVDVFVFFPRIGNRLSSEIEGVVLTFGAELGVFVVKIVGNEFSVSVGSWPRM